MDRTALVIDKDAALLELFRTWLEPAGWRVETAASGQEGLRLARASAPDAILLALGLPDVPGSEILPPLQRLVPGVPVVLVTGTDDLAATVAALRLGAEDFLLNPVSPQTLEHTLERAYSAARTRLAGGTDRGPGMEDDLHEACPKMRALTREARLLAESGLTVILLGESGTGKNRIARIMHDLSHRGDQAFVGLNCAGLNPTFLESELFGHERGAFTDAKHQKPGLFEVAHRGTFLLDEVGDLSLSLQPKLLHALERGCFRRLGGTQEVEVDVRLIAATNRNLSALVKEGLFREDLFYRLSVATLHLPPLRDREPAYRVRLVQQLFQELRSQRFRGPTCISSDAMDLLNAYPWPGNIRELRNVLERALALGEDDGQILPSDLPPVLRGPSSSPPPTPRPSGKTPPLPLKEIERRHIEATLAYFQGNRTRAAESLGISRVGLYKKLLRMESEPQEGCPPSPYLRQSPRQTDEAPPSA